MGHASTDDNAAKGHLGAKTATRDPSDTPWWPPAGTNSYHSVHGARSRSLLTMNVQLTTDRLLIREWSVDDAEQAQAIYGNPDVTYWLTPEMEQVNDVSAMRAVLQAWVQAQPNLLPPRGRWAVQRRQDGAVIGGLGIRLLPPYDEDLEISWQIRPDCWGNGFAPEAGGALIDWAFTKDVDELFAVARPNNTRAIAAAKQVGMQWVGETSKYYDMRLQVYRVRPNELIH